MNNVPQEHVLKILSYYIEQNDGDEATEQILINVAADILDISQDKVIDLLSEQKSGSGQHQGRVKS